MFYREPDFKDEEEEEEEEEICKNELVSACCCELTSIVALVEGKERCQRISIWSCRHYANARK